jgi:hypothetical protein
MLLPETAGDVGCVVKPTFASVVGFTVMTELVSVVRFSVVSVAKRVHEVPVLIATAVNVATPPTAATLMVPARLHDEVIRIVSVEVATSALDPSSIDTAKLANGDPAVVGDVGSVVKTTLAGAPAADAAVAVANTTPVTKRAEQAPTERILPSAERKVRPPPRLFVLSMVSPLPCKRFNKSIEYASTKG